MKAVITGDIVQSTRMSPKDIRRLIDELDYALDLWGRDFEVEYEIFRGDSFQCLLQQSKYALRVALLIKTLIKSLNPSEPGEVRRGKGRHVPMLYPVWKFDVRIAIGIGEIAPRSASLGKSNGDAFVLSGRTLDDLKTGKQTMGIATLGNYRNELETEMVLLDFIITRMTALQSEVIGLKLLGYTETDIANRLEINQSAVNQRSNSAGWHAINSFVQRFESLDPNG